MNCAHCRKELPENYGAVYCPFCGKDLPPPDRLPGANPRLEPVKFRPVIFFTALLAPPVLTMLAAALCRGPNDWVSVNVGVIGGFAGGAISGILLGLRAGQTVGARVLLSCLFIAILSVVCITLCCFGCNFGGYRLRID